MRTILFASILILNVCCQHANSTGFEIPRSHIVSIKDSKTQRHYDLYIKYPENYETTARTYPVVYYTDAYWHIEMLSALSEFVFPDVVLVGIAWQTDTSEALREEVGPFVSRYRDYSYAPSSNPEHQQKYEFGQAEAFLEFIRRDVISYVEKNERVERDNRTYFGYSLGGAFGAFSLLSQPDTFQHYILGSPSVWKPVTDYVSLDELSALNGESAVNVFISHGDLESELSVHVKRFVDKLTTPKLNSVSVDYHIIDGDHTSAFPETAVRAFKWLASKNPKTTEKKEK